MSLLSRRTTPRWSSTAAGGRVILSPPAGRTTRGRRPWRLALLAGLVVAFLLGIGGLGLGLQSDLTLVINSLDLSSYPQATIGVQLGGEAAATLGDLDAGAFALQVDGRPVAVDSVQAAGDVVNVPTQTVLLVDESGSMKGEAIQGAAAAAAAFIEAMRPEDRAAIQAFNEGFRTLAGFTGDQGLLKASLAQLQPAKETALYDALLRAFETLEGAGPGGARYLILLSDGGDTASTATFDQVLAVARAAGVPVYAIGLKTTEFDSAPLVSLAEATGGRYLETPDPEALVSLYQTLAKELHNQYLLRCTLPAAAAATGDLTVTVAAGGRTAAASQGFFYPTTTTAAAETTTTTGTAVTTAPGTTPGEVAQEGLLDRFVRWKGSSFIIGAVVFILVLFFALFLNRALLPRRNVLAEYSGALERRRALSPHQEGEEARVPGILGRMSSRLLAIRGYQEPLQKMLDDAALKMRASEFALLHLVGVVVVIILAWSLGAPLLLTLILALVVILVPLLWLSSKGNARRKAFNDQVPNTLVLLAGSLKAGQGFEQALAVAAREAPEPTASEFKRALAEMRLGVPPEEALRTIADRMRSEAFDWAVMSTIIQRQVGGNLAEIYESTASVLRERAKLHRTIKTLTAEGRLSAIILIILPFAIGTMIAIVNRDYLKPLVTTGAGLALLAVAAVLMVIGVFWMRAVVRVDK
jgi:tight adherence protein B